MINLYPFSLVFNEKKIADFPFIIDNRVLDHRCIISSCFAGNMNEDANRHRFFSDLNIKSEYVYACKQIHSQNVFIVDRDTPNNYPEGDGLISCDSGILLSVVVADCLPIFLYDSENGVFGLVHSGWQGTGIVLKAIDLMRERWNTRVEKLALVLGPCIQSCCYSVSEERARFFESSFGGNYGEYPLGDIIRCDKNIFYVNLQSVNARLLANAGVKNIAYCQNCTFTDLSLGSFRREGANYTRMLALV